MRWLRLTLVLALGIAIGLLLARTETGRRARSRAVAAGAGAAGQALGAVLGGRLEDARQRVLLEHPDVAAAMLRGGGFGGEYSARIAQHMFGRDPEAIAEAREKTRIESPPCGLVPLTSFPLDRNRIIGRCQGTQLKLPLHRHPRRLRIDQIAPGHVPSGLGCFSQRAFALGWESILLALFVFGRPAVFEKGLRARGREEARLHSTALLDGELQQRVVVARREPRTSVIEGNRKALAVGKRPPPHATLRLEDAHTEPVLL